MQISSTAGHPPVQSPAALAAERAVIVLKKHQDVQKAQAAALIDLVEQAAATGVGRLINVYA